MWIMSSMMKRALALIALSAGCSSSYMPQSRGKVAVIMSDGKPAYVRDGKVYDHGLLGGGLVEVVHGNPAAERAANEYHDRMTTGLVGLLGGTACSIGAMLYAAHDVSRNPDDDHPRAEKALYVALGCTIIMIVGGGYLATAEPYRWDAINIFNDAPAPPPMPGTPGYAGWSAQKTSMKMRDEITVEPTSEPAATTPSTR